MTTHPTDELALKRILTAAAVLLWVETVVLLGLGAWLAIDIISGLSRSLPAAIALAALVLGAGVWLQFVAKAVPQNHRWARSAAIFWQTCQLAVASASFTGRGANIAIGAALVVASVAVLALLFSKPVIAASRAQLEEKD